MFNKISDKTVYNYAKQQTSLAKQVRMWLEFQLLEQVLMLVGLLGEAQAVVCHGLSEAAPWGASC